MWGVEEKQRVHVRRGDVTRCDPRSGARHHLGLELQLHATISCRLGVASRSSNLNSSDDGVMTTRRNDSLRSARTRAGQPGSREIRKKTETPAPRPLFFFRFFFFSLSFRCFSTRHPSITIASSSAHRLVATIFEDRRDAAGTGRESETPDCVERRLAQPRPWRQREKEQREQGDTCAGKQTKIDH